MKKSPTYTASQLETLQIIYKQGWNNALDRRSILALLERGALEEVGVREYLVTPIGIKVIERRAAIAKRRKGGAK
jgi:hypothetical protein